MSAQDASTRAEQYREVLDQVRLDSAAVEELFALPTVDALLFTNGVAEGESAADNATSDEQIDEVLSKPVVGVPEDAFSKASQFESDLFASVEIKDIGEPLVVPLPTL